VRFSCAKTVLPEGGESIIPALDALIEKLRKGVEQFVMRWHIVVV
jgi:hypothetical protein